MSFIISANDDEDPGFESLRAAAIWVGQLLKSGHTALFPEETFRTTQERAARAIPELSEWFDKSEWFDGDGPAPPSDIDVARYFFETALYELSRAKHWRERNDIPRELHCVVQAALYTGMATEKKTAIKEASTQQRAAAAARHRRGNEIKKKAIEWYLKQPQRKGFTMDKAAEEMSRRFPIAVSTARRYVQQAKKTLPTRDKKPSARRG